MSDQTDAAAPDAVSVDAETAAALRIAENMIKAGVPIFAAPPCPAAHGGTCPRPGHNGREEYDLPNHWQKTVPSTVWIERWKPGWALAAVGGRVADFLDNDPRNGGDASMAELMAAGHMPRVYGVAETPSGGQHFTIAPLGERKGELMPGVDYQGGTPDGEGLGFVWLAPTVRRSKSIDHMGERRPYRWVQEPDLEWLAEGGDESGEMVRARLVAARASKGEPRVDDRTERLFTEAEAKAFCTPLLDQLRRAQIGGIETAANNVAAQLSHFVPEIWDADFAYSVLMGALSETAYDPDHPAASWAAEKFRAVLDGTAGRAPGDWKAQRKRTPEQELAVVEPDAVDALLAEMLTPGQIKERPPKRYLIKGLVHLDSEVWVIGAPGAKKSFVVLDQAAHVAGGVPWQGMPVTQGPVVIIAAEGAGGLGARVKAWEKEYGRPMPECVHILPRPVQAANAGAWAVLVRACERLRPVMVVGDTQARITVGLEENSATDMGLYVSAIGAVRAATGAAVFSVHHIGRSGGDARGSSAIDGAQDTELKVVALAEKLCGEVRVEKQKDLPEREPIKIAFKVHTVGMDEDGDPITSLAVRAADAWLESEVGATLPEEWEVRWLGVQRQIIQVLADQGGQVGLTKAQARANVADRWYAGETGRKSGLRTSTFDTAWTRVLEARTADGDPIVTGAGGQRYALDPIALKAYTEPS